VKRYTIHHFDRDDVFRGFVCTPSPPGAPRSIDCNDGDAGCGARVGDLQVLRSGLLFERWCVNATLDLIANGAQR
jgi:hypothetical protein